MIYALASIGILGFIVWSHHMFTVGLDVDSFVSTIMVTLLISPQVKIKIGQFAEKLHHSFGPLSLGLFGKIQTLGAK